MWAVLCREPFFLTREQFLDLDDWTLTNVYFRPNANEGNEKKLWYWPVDREDKDNPVTGELSLRDLFMTTTGEAMNKLGYSEADIEARFEKWSSSYTGPENLKRSKDG